jgi:hypothetical protein
MAQFKYKFSKGDTVSIGKTIKLAVTNKYTDEIKVIPVGTKGFIYSVNHRTNMIRIFFGFKDKRFDCWIAKWKPVTCRMVLTEKTRKILTVDIYKVFEICDVR